MYQIILASQSPRRKEILQQVGVAFTVIPSNKEEVITSEDPVQVVKDLARMKALDIAEQTEEDQVIIIGADTVVVHKNQILGKPKSEVHAFEMLMDLQGNQHEVYSGVALVIQRKGQEQQIINFAVCTKVGISPMTKQQIDEYVASGEPLDKAGAYAIQGKFAVYVNELLGDYYNVVGLPISQIYEKLLEQEIDLVKAEDILD